MRILILDPYYPEFLRSVYDANPTLGQQPYAQQWRTLMDECFGVADFYSRNLRAFGHEAEEVVPNCVPLQRRWLEENGGTRTSTMWVPTILNGLSPSLSERLTGKWLQHVLVARVALERPDVIHIQDMPGTSPALLRALRPYVRAITGQIACEYPVDADFREYDLVLSSIPDFVQRFRDQGLNSAHLKLGFEPRVLDRIPDGEFSDVAFVGGVSPAHLERVRFLEQLSEQVPIAWWGYGVEHLAADSPLRRRYRGPAWGLGMYGKLRGARIALNVHINIAGRNANNMRLYEATGVGSLLLTDRKANLHEHFEIDREVAVFGNVQECREKIEYFLAHEAERAAVARAGQQRTLTEHTYRNRMQEYVEFVHPLLSS